MLRHRPILILASIAAVAAFNAEQRKIFIEAPVPQFFFNMTAVKYQAGEAAVGASAGALAAWVLRRVQSAATTLAILGSVGTFAALHLKWVSGEQVRYVATAAARMVYSRLVALFKKADLDGDGEVTLDDGHLAFEKTVPIVRRHTALASGLAAGFVTAYSLR